MLRKIVAALLVLLAFVFWFGPAISGETGTDEYEEMLADVLVGDTVNNTRTEGAPQQQVVNGWTARDLLTLQVQQNNDLLAAQYRQTALLTLVLIGIGWLILANDRRPGAKHASGADASSSPPTEPLDSDVPATS